MKKVLATVLLSLTMLTAQADDYPYPYLVMTTSSGEQAAVAVDELVITFSDGKLMAKNASGTQSFTLSELASMSFAATADIADGIESVSSDSVDAQAVIYDLSGRRMNLNTTLPQGVYIVKQNGKTKKMYVK